MTRPTRPGLAVCPARIQSAPLGQGLLLMEEQPHAGRQGPRRAGAFSALWAAPDLGLVPGSRVGSGGPACCPFPSPRGCDGGGRDLWLPRLPEGSCRGRIREAPWRRKGLQGPPSTHLPRERHQQGRHLWGLHWAGLRPRTPGACGLAEAPGLQEGLAPHTPDPPWATHPPWGPRCSLVHPGGLLGGEGPHPTREAPGVRDEVWRMKKQKGRGAPGRRGGRSRGFASTAQQATLPEEDRAPPARGSSPGQPRPSGLRAAIRACDAPAPRQSDPVS